MSSKSFNCSLSDGEIPVSGQFFQAIQSDLWIFIIPAVLTFLILILFLEEMGFLLRNIRTSKRRRLSLWILGIYPVFAVTSLIAMYIPRSASLCSFVASIYHSITLWKFLGLIRDFFGGKRRMLELLNGQLVSPNPFPCCCCCCLPLITINSVNLSWMTVAVFQLSVVRTILFFLLLVLWSDGKYDYGDVAFINPNSYVNIIIGVSTFVSFYGYLLYYKATKNSLHGYGLQGKFICIIVVLVLFGLQSGILETMGALSVIPCFPPFSVDMRSQIIFHYAVIVEMFFISLLARYCFRKVEPGQDSPDGLSKASSPKSNQAAPACSFPETDSSSLGVNPAYSSDPEDAPYRIEHTPLEKFDFRLAKKPAPDSCFVSVPLNEREGVTRNLSGSQRQAGPGTANTVEVTAQINQPKSCPDVMLV
ncbi:organic solute transporter subunit alpha [Hemiscyllium ocellatum]|uniref:organic solute transporter subunit alpha n=1 Tax=Hemiscyllium ocellatum TaxID=170820 RepID=UPI0029671533|nr:organic solute transporter subunit alpha [Hemiscyllium ocellatum]